MKTKKRWQYKPVKVNDHTYDRIVSEHALVDWVLIEVHQCRWKNEAVCYFRREVKSA